MATIYISVGSNEQRSEKIRAARRSLMEAFGPLQLSSVYESEAVGFDGPAFYNLVVEAQTTWNPAEVEARLKSIEQEHGRIADGIKYSNKKLDLDLLLYDDLIQAAGPQLPRAEITENAFVLWPLAEIAGDLCHPVTQLSYRQHWLSFNKSQNLKPIDFRW